MSFVPLRVKTAFSLLKSPVRLTDLVTKAKDLGYQSLGISDLNVMYAVPAFYNLCVQNNIKPILGLTIELPGIILSEQQYQISLVAMNNQGYQNLMAISSLVNTSQELTVKGLQGRLSGLTMIIPAKGEVSDLIVQGNSKQVSDLVATLDEVLPDDNQLKFGVDFHQSAVVVDMLSKTAADNGIKLVADVPVEYLNSEDLFLNKVLNAIDSGVKLENVFDASKKRGDYFLRKANDVEQEFINQNLQGSIQELERIVANTDVTLTTQTPKLPQFENDKGVSSQEYLQQLCVQGLSERVKVDGIKQTDEYKQRLKHELSVIHSMGFDDYFLIVEDVIHFAHQAGIITGPGRGSAAGSLVAYVLKITDVDPIKYNLLFERFLNPERKQMPDIDLDIPDTRRDEVIQYVGDKYGHDRVGQIITFGTLAAKQAIRDVGRTFGLTTTQQNQWSKAIPNALHISLTEAKDNSQRLRNLISDSTINAELFRVASALEGLPRHYSTHAAGVVLSDDPLVNHVPLQDGNEGLVMSQYPKEFVETSGLLKMDFLGLRNLSILADILTEVNKSTGKQINPSLIPLNDPETIKLFDVADTTGIFQFESSGIRNVLKKIEPTGFDDVALVNALYRPGPMENIDEVVKRKHSSKPIEYVDDSLKSILSPTYGVIVYQEQVMLVANQLAGFSLGQADMLRRAMSKKKFAVMEGMKVTFIDGAKQRGYSEQVATQTFEYIEKFANYGFNKSHAYAYSKMAMELAFLKVHYPGEFHVALLRSVHSNPVKVKQYVADAKKRKISVIAPSINESSVSFTFTNQQIRFGLGSIKGIRSDFVRAIIDERTENGKYKSFQNFLSRIDERFRKPDAIEALIYSGCFDEFANNRAELIAAAPEFINSINLSGNSMSLFKALEPKMPHLDDLPLVTKLAKEDELLGAYISGHPTERFKKLAEQMAITSIADLVPDMKTVNILLYVSKVKVIRTKTGKQMAFVDGNDDVGDLSVTVFPNLFNKVQSWLKKDIVLLINGNVEAKDSLELIANEMVPASNVLSKYKRQQPKVWYLRLPEGTDKRKLFVLIRELAKGDGDAHPVVVYEPATKKTTKLENRYWLPDGKPTYDQLITILGQDNVVYK